MSASCTARQRYSSTLSKVTVHCMIIATSYCALFMVQTQYGMVRRYKELSVMNLLYLQAQIHSLKTQLDQEIAADAASVDNTERPLWNYHWLSLATSGTRGDGKRWKIWLELHEAIDRHNRVVALSPPTNAQRDFLSKYISDDGMNGGRCGFMSAELVGDNPAAYQKLHLEDLVMFEAPASGGDSLLDKCFVEPAMKVIHIALRSHKRTIMQDLEAGLPSPEGDNTSEHEKTGENSQAAAVRKVELYQYSAPWNTFMTKFIRTGLSILLPCAAILSLNAVPGQNTRVYLVCMFSVVFSMGMAMFTQTRGTQVFAVTAAFMSVLLVFCGGNGSGN
ncbi:hypothetical protein M406DRAFT_335217 [Cryphonectria parasitica EP155]|uniref:DUF6594 domain-containing protein n=1 Tax=Cryphonectria parasitica (strain ATCC 38755 / EP155) TaxID=660469 RepID=A0A9P4XSA8_CRYP1|nr:uncharacterized protein M406DRAFT_335217 [Cryphonectria parasitica EP155]KAF3760006.1 hypothetical protein M406DRAFT_335217 [Cryphonectria parasitica EP155]